MEPRHKNRRPSGPSRWRRIRPYIGWSIVALVFLALADVAYIFLTLPPLPAGGFDPTRATTVYAADGTAVGPLSGDVLRIPVSMQEMPPYLPQAFVASEDVRFYQHHGVDPKGVGRALVTDLRTGRIEEGGSTITQQVVKNTFLTARQTVQRKVQEMALAVALERRYTKDEILTIYLNQIYTGNGAYGMGAAAKLYFNKKVGDLTLGEAATLTGMTPGPESFNPLSHPELALTRRNLVLDRMVAAGYLDATRAATEKAKPLSVSPGTLAHRNPYPWYMDSVRAELKSRYGLSERVVDLMGLKIYTGLDTRAQRAAEQALAAKIFPASAPDGLEGALAAVDPRSGEVRALVGGRVYAIRAGLNRAVDGQVPPGSSFKPVMVYGPVFEYAGLTPESTVEDTPLNIQGWQPKNFDLTFHGTVTVREAARESMNIPAIRLLQLVGLEKAKGFAQGLGIPFAKEDQSLTLALGSMAQGVSPLQMAASYQGFANGGTYNDPHVIVRVEASDGVLSPTTDVKSPQKAMSGQTAFYVTDILQTVVRNGTGQLALLGDRPMAGKTGTVELPATPAFQGKTGNAAAWFVGYTPDLVAAIWLGYDQVDAGHYLPAEVNGSTFPTRIWRQMASAALAGRPALPFPDISGRTAPAPTPAPTPAPKPPATPTGLPSITGLIAQTGITPGTVTLAWHSEGAVPPNLVYQVVRGTAADVPLDAAHTIATEKVTSITDSPPGPGDYYYRVVALDPSTGQQGPPSIVVKATIQSGTTPPDRQTPPGDSTPGAAQPGAGGGTPGAGDGTPGAGGTTPGTGGTAPGAGGTTPGAGGTTPGAGGTTPGAGGTTPGTGTPPGAGGGAPGTAPGAPSPPPGPLPLSPAR